MFHIIKYILESGILFSGMSIVWEDTNICANQYMCSLSIYLLTVLSSSSGNVSNVVVGINTTDKHYLKEQMELIDKFTSNEKSAIGMLLYIHRYPTCGHSTSEHVIEVHTLSRSGLTPSQPPTQSINQ